jgi:hypothetical protein
MDKLLDEYKRKLQWVTELIKNLKFKDNANPDYVRLTAKASCYRTIIAELEQELVKVL